MPRQLAELLQLSVEEVCADFDAMLRHDWRRLGISAGVLFVAHHALQHVKGRLVSALLERPVVSELCNAAMPPARLWWPGLLPWLEERLQWPCLTKEAQRYIACFETFAQWTTEGQAVHGLCMPSGTDNTASEAGVNKLFTTAWPLQIFVQLVAALAYKHKWSVLASHILGERNVWADQLSGGRFRFRPHDFWPHKSALSLHPADLANALKRAIDSAVCLEP